MASIAVANDERGTGFSTPVFRPSSRRTSSFSSSPSFSSNSSSGSLFSFHDSPIFSPNTPLRFSSRIPFSWEQIPGIPKNGTPTKKEYTKNLLPLPPPVGNLNPVRKNTNNSISPKKDPFFAALVECSKDDHSIGDFWKSSKVTTTTTKTLSDRFGFINIYTSCKKTCTVSESIVYLPSRSSRSYNMLNRRSS